MKKRLFFLLVSCLALSLTLTACNNDKDYELVELDSDEAATEVKLVTEIVEEEFPIKTEVDPELKSGEHKIVQQGERGQNKVTYEITYKDGVEVSRKAVSEEIIKKPVEALVKVGPTAEEKQPGEQEVIGHSEPSSSSSSSSSRRNNSSSVLRRIQSDPNLSKPSTPSRPSKPAASSESPRPASSSSKPAESKPSRPSHPSDITISPEKPSESSGNSGGGDIVVPKDPSENSGGSGGDITVPNNTTDNGGSGGITVTDDPNE